MEPQPDNTNSETCDAVPPADRRNGYRIVVTSLLWATVFVASTWTLTAESGPTGFAAWAIAGVCAALLLVALAAFRRFLLDADELTQRIQLEGVAFGFAAGVLFSLSYGLFNEAGAPDMSMTHAGTVLVFGYVAGILRATHQYT
ncbi:MAG: hypothetical protein ACRBK7_01945 [Acidimicrobiales bacterium]